MLEGYQWRQKESWRLAAFQVCGIVNNTVKLRSPLTIDKLLGEKKAVNIPSRQDQVLELEKLKQEIGPFTNGEKS